jgi:hypothetical protein
MEDSPAGRDNGAVGQKEAVIQSGVNSPDLILDVA